MRIVACLALAAAAWIPPAHVFQIAPLSTDWEEAFTREPISGRARAADKLGRLIKGPVHEELAQLAFGCPFELKELATYTKCADRTTGFANPYIIYGVRWNDLPPFSLRKGEGRKCTKFLTGGPACNVSQTIRFATQPDCWYCMFKSAEKIAASKRRIVGCKPAAREKGSRIITANLLARSHYEDLQFLHAMAQADGEDPARTRADVLGWLEFAWKVAMREIPHATLLRDVPIAAMKERFHCSGWSVADLYILGRQTDLLPQIRLVAFGSVLHTVQDSFAGGHVEREAAAPGETCPGKPDLLQPGRIVEFHGYAEQDGDRHDSRDVREAMVRDANGGVSHAVEASRQLWRMFDDRSGWDAVSPYMDCLFALAKAPRPASAGESFRRR